MTKPRVCYREMLFYCLRHPIGMLIFGIVAIALIKNLLDRRESLESKGYLLFHMTQSGIMSGQPLVDYIAANLVVEYIRDDDDDDKVFITLTNSGPVEIPGEKWSLYFNHADGFHDVANKRFKEIGKSGVVLRHWCGWFFSLEPLLNGNSSTSFTSIKPNQTLIVYEKAILKSKSYSFPKWYVSGNGLEPRIVQSTSQSRPRCRFSFETPSSKTNYNRFNQNNVPNLNRSVKTVIPTPLLVKNFAGEVRIDKDWKVVYGRDLQEEAKFLEEKLQIPAVSSSDSTATLKRIIHLERKDIDSHFTQFTNSRRLNLDEGYTIKIKPSKISIRGKTSHGIFHGIQSLLSLLENGKDGNSLPLLEMADAPRFAFRGFMYDAARNFIDKNEVLKTIKLMAMYKLNKLHLHLTDDQGWRIEIPTLPELTEIGSRRGHDLNEERSLMPFYGFGPTQDPLKRQYYTVDDYKDILRHANIHHIEVIPEFDMPGHAHAAVQSMRMRYMRMKQNGYSEESASEFLLHDFNDTSWYLGINEQTDTVMNPCIESTYAFVKEIVRTIISLHQHVQPLKTIHFGGDEVPYGALVKSPECIALTTAKPELTGNLKFYFMKRIISIANEFDVRVQTWNDGLSHPWETPVNANEWKIKAGVAVNIYTLKSSAYHFANKGYEVILSQASRLYLDNPYEPDSEETGLFWATRYVDSRVVFNFMFSVDFGTSPNSDFLKMETCRMLALEPCIELQRPENIIGMQASLWGEMIQSNEDFEYMLCPRLLAFADRAWHMADWETASSEKEMKDLREVDWTDFANTLGYKELRRLERLGVKYRLPVPGFRVKEDKVEVNIEFPGSLLQYSTDDGETWNTYHEGKLLENSKHLRFSVASHDLQRRSRIISV